MAWRLRCEMIKVIRQIEDLVGYDHHDYLDVGLLLLAASIRHCFCIWDIWEIRDIPVCSEYGVLIGHHLLSVVEAALELSRDIYLAKKDVNENPFRRFRSGEVCGLFEDATRYFYMLTTASLSCSFLQTRQGDSRIKLLPPLVEKISSDNAILKQIQIAFLSQNSSLECISEDDSLRRGPELGRGSYSTVYSAKWKSEKRKSGATGVVVKELFDSKDWEWTDKLIRKELELQRKVQSLDSTNILQILAYCGKRGESKSLILELMDLDLKKLIQDLKAQKKIGQVEHLPDALDVMVQIAKGMRVLHSINVVHRDLKPANVLVRNLPLKINRITHVWRAVKVADFGEAKEHFSTLHSHTLNRGTLVYMAPEMLDGSRYEGSYTRSVDVYSFGIMFSEILSGERPYQTRNFGNIAELKQLLEQGERPLLPEWTPPVLKDLIQRCWHGDANSRPTFDWICKRLWLFKEALLWADWTSTSTSFGLLISDKLKYWLRLGCLTFGQICECLSVDPADVLTDIHLSEILVQYLASLSLQSDSAAWQTFWDQLRAASKGVVDQMPEKLSSLLLPLSPAQGVYQRLMEIREAYVDTHPRFFESWKLQCHH